MRTITLAQHERRRAAYLKMLDRETVAEIERDLKTACDLIVGMLLGMQALAGHALGGKSAPLAFDGCGIRLPGEDEERELPVTLSWAPGVELDRLRDAVRAIAFAWETSE